MANDVMTNEEFRAHIKRMVTWMQNNEQLIDYCPCCLQPINHPLNEAVYLEDEPDAYNPSGSAKATRKRYEVRDPREP